MKTYLFCLVLGTSAASCLAAVRVYVEDAHGSAAIKYECTAGEVVRAFALDVSVNQGRIVGVSDFFRGQSRAGNTGYGVFPASFRDHIVVGPGTNVNWSVPEYTPVASTSDAPDGTLPGLNSSGVTLEFGGLWNPKEPEAVPAPAGTLCVLHLSGPARVSIAPNMARGGVISTEPAALTPVFVAATVGPVITSFSFADGLVRITFQGGELQTATALEEGWTNTGNTNGVYSELFGEHQTRFYRVRGLSSL